MDTDWGIHYETVLPLYNVGVNDANGIILFNSYRQAKPFQSYNFSICGFHNTFPEPNVQIGVSSKQARINYRI